MALVVGASLVGVLGAAVPSQAAKVTGYILSGPANATYNFPTIRAVATKGSTVVYRNLDIVLHNVRFTTLGVASPFLSRGQTFTFTNVTKKKGTFAFVCDFHPDMTGALIVR